MAAAGERRGHLRAEKAGSRRVVPTSRAASRSITCRRRRSASARSTDARRHVRRRRPRDAGDDRNALAMYQNQHHERLAEAAELDAVAEDHVARLQDIIGELDQSVDFFLLERSRQAAIRKAQDARLKREEAARKRGGATRSKALSLASAPSGCRPGVNRFARARTSCSGSAGRRRWTTRRKRSSRSMLRRGPAGTARDDRGRLGQDGRPRRQIGDRAARRTGAPISARAPRAAGPPPPPPRRPRREPRRRARAGTACRGASIPESWPRARLRGRPIASALAARPGTRRTGLSVHSDTFAALLPAAARQRRARVLRRLPVGARRRRRERAAQPVGARVGAGARRRRRAPPDSRADRAAAIDARPRWGASKRSARPAQCCRGASLTRALRAMREYPRIDDFKSPRRSRWIVSSLASSVGVSHPRSLSARQWSCATSSKARARKPTPNSSTRWSNWPTTCRRRKTASPSQFSSASRSRRTTPDTPMDSVRESAESERVWLEILTARFALLFVWARARVARRWASSRDRRVSNRFRGRSGKANARAIGSASSACPRTLRPTRRRSPISSRRPRTRAPRHVEESLDELDELDGPRDPEARASVASSGKASAGRRARGPRVPNRARRRAVALHARARAK